MLHFSGYSAWTLDAIKNYHAPTMDGIAAGHPEIEFPGIEVTTGPLGQGIGNAVGMAMAGKNLGAKFNKDGYEVIGQKIWCFTGEGCLQEGIGQEGESTVDSESDPWKLTSICSALTRWALWSRQSHPSI